MSSVDPTLKHYHWLDFQMGLFEAYERGGDTVVLTDDGGLVTEGPGFNIFCINESGIFTPDEGVLEGITRKTVFDLADELNLPISKKNISVAKLKNANELFATSTAGGIMPITKVNGQKISNGMVGNITRKIHKLYWLKHYDQSWTTSVKEILGKN